MTHRARRNGQKNIKHNKEKKLTYILFLRQNEKDFRYKPRLNIHQDRCL